MKHQQSSEFVDLTDYQLHLRRLAPLQRQHAPVLMLHGVIENSRIFYSSNGKGLGCYLADQGFAVYCADFPGRGLSVPAVSADFNHSQHQLICRDIPALIDQLYDRYQQKIHLICHSWGGVLLVASLARFPHLLAKVQSCCYFGTKRQISVQSIGKRWQIDTLWNRLAPWLCQKYGYLPAKQLRFGADNEPAQFLQDTVQWIKPSAFTDPTDQFDYARAAQQVVWPASWFIAGARDYILGHPTDMQLFMAESALSHARYTLLGKAQGDAVDFDHIGMLTHPAAVHGHFPRLASWLTAQESQARPAGAGGSSV